MKLNALNKLLDGSEIRVVNIEDKAQSNNKIKLGIFAAAVLAIAATGIHIYNSAGQVEVSQNTPSKEAKTSVIESVKNSIMGAVGLKIENPIYDSSLVNPEQKVYLEKIAQFDIPKGYKDNQIARHVAQVQFKDNQFLLSLASEAEGFRSKIYNDNIGFAFGNGWNISMQKAEYNEKIAKTISQDPLFIKKIPSLSGKIADYPVSGDFANIQISPQRSIQVVALMSQNFKNEGVLKNLEKVVSQNGQAKEIQQETGKSYTQITEDIFNSLAPNEQASLVYHAYKVGAAGFGKYKGLMNEIVNYGFSKDRNLESKKAVAEHFTYKYKMNGQIKDDIRASTLIASMFVDPQAFGYVIGKNVAPKNLSTSVPQFSQNKIDVNAKEGEVSIPDPVGDMRKEIESKGGKIDIKIIPEESGKESLENLRKNNQKRGISVHWL